MSPLLLEVRDVVAGYRPDLPILHGVSLHVGTAEMVTVIGPNGAGKSTLVKAIAGLVPISAGSVAVEGTEVTNLLTHKLATASIAYVPQTANVFTSLTIDENLKLGASTLSKADAGRRIAKAYEDFPALTQYRGQKAKVLSGGQRQMLAVARALLTEPRLLMLDEPSAGLSPLMVSEVFSRLKTLIATGVSILMVEQNVKAALAISDRTYVLAEGRNRIDGDSAKLAGDTEVAAIYLGAGGRKR
ncbi:ABC transporter ATP-binding protein [Neorhizobium sp. CSC1952]|uniref:ABC transporter ATP-binding protein n=1 Tax=Neorhizobium sp. CSC1952 TaxID=2978974 RepID=UPI0025A52F03|nr:ABC transporter ATP-binding protein [Rhizobium sp. CSC1952]WJR68258.1 ABC transporter ATP-binding protein [Rhizobium sp. CSC1952]